MMHFAGLMGECREDQDECGFDVKLNGKHSWEKM